MTTGKTIALTRWTFVVKVMSLLFNILCYALKIFVERVDLILSVLAMETKTKS